MKESCEQEKVLAKEKYQKKIAELEKEHQSNLSKLTDHQEVKDEKYVHKNQMLMRRWSWRRNFSRSRTEGTRHSHGSII